MPSINHKTRKPYTPAQSRALLAQWLDPHSKESGGERRAFCPHCEDPGSSRSPSASINFEKGVWYCQKGQHHLGSVHDLTCMVVARDNLNVRSILMKARNADPAFAAKRAAAISARGNLPTDAQVSRWHAGLLKSDVVLKRFVEKRGYSEHTLREWRIGWDGDRYTLPVYDEDGELVNVRRYALRKIDPKFKMISVPGHGSARIFNPRTLAGADQIVLAEGEWDAIALCAAGIPAVAHTGGASVFKEEWAAAFTGKAVYICYDVDDAGEAGARKAAVAIAPYAQELYIVELPLSTRGADVTDFLLSEGQDADSFRALMEKTKPWGVNGGPGKKERPVSGERLDLLGSMSQETLSRIIELEVSVCGKQQTPFSVPREVTVTCTMSKGKVCLSCPVMAGNGSLSISIDAHEESLFRMVDSSEDRNRKVIKEITGQKCLDAVTFDIADRWVVEELLVQPAVDSRDTDGAQPVRRTVYSVSTHGTPVNRKVRLLGQNVYDHKVNALQFMAWENEQIEADLDRFELTPDLRGALQVFQPADGQSPLDKCIEIAGNMSENVTMIYGRDLLHVAYDLVWHSVNSFRVHAAVVPKGWLEMMVLGDTRTGKSETAERLAAWYRCGVIKPCEGASFAGVVGGVQQINGRWHLTWGVVPMNDRRLVVLDEMSGLKDKDIIEQMSSIRSSGRAEITKISTETTHARTRLIWISNPIDGSMLRDNMSAGLSALKKLVKNSEDVARFDFVMAVMTGTVPVELINAGNNPNPSPAYSQDECEALVKWAWSLKRDDVHFTQRGLDYLPKAAKEMSDTYTADPPLVQGENVRLKLLRVAAALAARTFSVSKAGKLVVDKIHIQDAVRFLNLIYQDEAMPYLQKSRRDARDAQIGAERKEHARMFLVSNPDTVLAALQAVGEGTFRVQDFTNNVGMTDSAAKEAIKKLLEWRMIGRRARGDLVMLQPLNEVLQDIERRAEAEEL